jgi:hypothetical protein
MRAFPLTGTGRAGDCRRRWPAGLRGTGVLDLHATRDVLVDLLVTGGDRLGDVLGELDRLLHLAEQFGHLRDRRVVADTQRVGLTEAAQQHRRAGQGAQPVHRSRHAGELGLQFVAEVEQRLQVDEERRVGHQ